MPIKKVSDLVCKHSEPQRLGKLRPKLTIDSANQEHYNSILKNPNFAELRTGTCAESYVYFTGTRAESYVCFICSITAF